ncbi:L-type lectin-domain containing protein [Enterococcus ureasiticus]|uniref:WxL domain-containing protein n=1 Tax=Enterococcus ureasiticus TaxID=903984 RepID=A0A1E5GAJ4_9ENTE|nr:L-type lectin-domain containing protein [Enterococcus ureasiticus]OEG09724.1 hypothetical protein BCR21_15405 [Enterococcus ureasiticus]
MKNVKSIIVVLGILVCCAPLTADAIDAPQSVPLDGIFATPSGANSKVDGNSVIITEKKATQVGAIFSTEANKMDLTKNFRSEMYINIDGDADGVVFVMHNHPEKTITFSGNQGKGLGIYADRLYGSGNNWIVDPGGDQLKKSFAIEFDPYHNGDNYDENVSKNDDKGHVAYAFPDKASTYTRSSSTGAIRNVIHSGVQYPSFRLGDGKWRLLKLDWESWDASKNGTLTYEYGDLGPVKVTINRDTFATDNVYWGFTGSTGASMEQAVVAFKSVPGLVNYDESIEFLDAGGEVVESTKQDSEVTVHYAGKYISGKQNFLTPTFKFTLPPNQKYQTNTFYLNNQLVTPTVVGNTLSVPLGKDLSLLDSKVDIKFKVKDINVTGDMTLPVNAEVAGLNFISNLSGSYNIDYVKDTEAPTGIGKVTFVDKGDTFAIEHALDDRDFLLEYQDDISPTEKIKIDVKKGQNFAAIVGTVGPSSFNVTLTDEVGNARDITIPLFIIDTQVALGTDYLIYGQDFSVIEKEYPKTESELLTMIREKSALKLWSYTDRAVTTMDNKLADLDIKLLPNPILPGVYKVGASYGLGTKKVERKVNATIIQSFATVKVLHLIDDGIGVEVPGVTNPPTVTGELGEAYSIPKFDSPDYLLSKVTVDGVEQPTSNVPVTGIYGDTKEVIFYYQNKPKLSASLAISKPSILEGEKVTFTSQIKNTAEDPSLLTNVVYTTTNAFPENVNVNLDTVKVNDKPITAGKAKLGTDRKLTIDLGDLTPMTDYKVTYEVESKKKVPPLTTTVKVEQAYTLKGESIGGTEVTGDSGAVKSFTINPGKAILDVFYYEETDNDIEYIDQDDTREATAGEKVTIYPKDMPGYKMTKVVINNEKTILAEDLPVTKEVEVEYGRTTLVEYYYVGLLEFKSAPSMYDFGVVEGSVQKSKFQPQSVEGSLVVSDSRTDKQPWTLKAKVTTPLHHTEKENVILPEAIKYKNADGVVALNDSSRAVVQHKNTEKDYDVTSEEWSKGEGFFLEISDGKLSSLGRYNAEIEITLENAK